MTSIPIVALDVGSTQAALELVRRLGDSCRFYKVGSELFTAAGPAVVEALRAGGHEVFLDLKYHDIPHTVRGAVRSAAALGVSLVTVHASGGEAMLRAAVEGGAEGGGARVLAVTVLTSFDATGLAAAWGRHEGVAIDAEVSRLAELAERSGAHGVVCSGHEASLVRARFGGRLATLVPGLRFSEGGSDDQSRVMTPASAAAAGARYLVLGRAVTGAAEPAAAMVRVWAEIAGAGVP